MSTKIHGNSRNFCRKHKKTLPGYIHQTIDYLVDHYQITYIRENARRDRDVRDERTGRKKQTLDTIGMYETSELDIKANTRHDRDVRGERAGHTG